MDVTKQIQINNDELPLEYMNGFEKLTIEDMEKLNSKTFEYKKLLEDKAKTSLFSVTISITLILNFIDVIFKVDYFRPLLIALVIVAVTNMILAGKMALDVVGDLNVFSELFPDDYYKKKKIKKEILAYSTEQNVNYNIIRNNHVYLSNKSILVSLVFISLIATLYICGKINMPNESNKQNEILKQLVVNSNETNKQIKDINDNLTIISHTIENSTLNSTSPTLKP